MKIHLIGCLKNTFHWQSGHFLEVKCQVQRLALYILKGY